MILGIDEIASPENQCLIASREIADLRNYVNDPLAEKFADIFFNERTDQNEIDPVSTHLIKTMSDRSRKLVTDKNTTFYSVLWRYDDVISPIHHKEYLSKLCSDLSSALKQLIDKDVPKTIFDEKDEVFDECHQHWLRCKHLSADFHGRESEYAKVVEYIQGSTETPLVIHGATGEGKTALLSKVASQVFNFHIQVNEILEFNTSFPEAKSHYLNVFECKFLSKSKSISYRIFIANLFTPN